jgi:hypothetical protein
MVACAPTPTQLVVVVDTDLRVPTELDGVRITVTRPDRTTESETENLADRTALPLTLSVIAEGEALGPIDVVADGLMGEDVVVSRAARVTLVRGESRMLVMHLVRSCVGRTCMPAALTCTEGGCVSREVRELPPWTGMPPGIDAGVRDAPGLDAPGADVPGLDAPGPDAPIGCALDADCDDGVACTTDSCGMGGVCQFSPNDSMCDDGNPCTDDACSAGGCTATNNTAPCDDGVFCNGVDVCGGGACVHPGDPCPAPTVCDAAAGACRGCTMRSHCPSDVTGAWTSCDYADGCDESGTRSRTDFTYDCVGGTCMGTPVPVMDVCMRDTDGATCGMGGCGGFGPCGGFSDACDESGSMSQTCTDLVCRAGTCRTEARMNSASCGRSTTGMTCGGETCGAYGPCNWADACAESATQSRTCSTPVCSGGACGGGTMRTDEAGCSRDTDGMSCGPSMACAAGGCVTCSRTLSGGFGTPGTSDFVRIYGSGSSLTFVDYAGPSGSVVGPPEVTFSGDVTLPIALWQLHGMGNTIQLVDWNGTSMGAITVTGASVTGSWAPPCVPSKFGCFPPWVQRVDGVAGGLALVASDGSTGSLSFACP